MRVRSFRSVLRARRCDRPCLACDPGRAAQPQAAHALACVLLLAALSFAPRPAPAQIYACISQDGVRVFSDSRCGPDAKVVPGVSTKGSRNSAAPRTPRPVKAPAELEALSLACDAGDMEACKEWALGGGPALLRDKERRAELECEAGSLAACEERYCRDGLTPDCRARVLRTAKLAGAAWYLRGEQRGRADGLVRYDIRCIPEGLPQPRDVAIVCSSIPGPDRCATEQASRRYSRLDQAAGAQCSTPAQADKR